MASTTFIDNQTTIYAAWLNDVNTAVYTGVFPNGSLSLTTLAVSGSVSGAGFTSLVNNTLSAPGPIGSATPSTGAFTTLTATTLTATGVTTPLPLKGTTSGTVSLAVPAVAGTNTITFPSGTGTVAVQGLSSNITNGTVVNATSGTSITFTGIPSWAKRVTVMFNGVSTTGSSEVQIQLGYASGFVTSGYTGSSAFISVANSGSRNYTTFGSAGFLFFNSIIDTNNRDGFTTINLFDSSTNRWVAEGSLGTNNETLLSTTVGTVALPGTLTQVRVTTVNGTDTFDAGSINIMWE
jgi:hypothetical protein